MDIYDSNGTKLEYSAVLANLPITESCEHVEELMKADHIVLSWRDSEKYTLPVGAYITYKGVNYALLEPYEPEQKSGDEYEYTPNFQHPKMYLGKVPFRFPTTDTEGNSITLLEWPYSGDIDTLLTFFCRTMESELGLTANTFNYSILGEIDMVVSTTFNAVDILSALSNIANQLKCEWHIDWDYKILYFGHIELSRDEVDETVLEVGVNVGTPSVRSSKEGFYNTYEPQGSTRNISKRAASGEYVQGDVRLALNEEDYPDKVIYTNESGTVIASLPQGVKKYVKPLIFDNIYPKLDLYVYDVRCRERYLLDDNGEKIVDHYEGSTPVYKRYAVWYMRLAYPTKVDGHVTAWTDYTINPETDIISGKNLGGAFQPNNYNGAESFPLAGRGNADDGGYGFELNYHTTAETIPANPNDGDTGVIIKAGDYEIVFQQQNDYILPTTASQGIIPKGVKVNGQEVTDLNGLTNLDDGQKGNIVDLYNIVIGSAYTESAQDELAQETLKYITNQFKDNNSYTLKSDVVAFKKRIDQDELLHTDSSLYIGEKVIYKNGDYELETRVMKLVTKLDYAFVQEITVGNEVLKGSTTTLKEQVQTILSGGGGNGSGGGVDAGAVRKIVQAYANPRFLSKLNDDTAQGFITMLKGLQVGANFVPDILGEGGCLRMRDDGKVELVTDILYARMRAYFDSVVIREYKHESGNRIVSPAQGFNASRVAYIKVVNNEETIVESASDADYFRCYWRVDDGEKKTENQFVIGDLAFCEHADVVNGSLVTKRYWRVVVGRNAGNTTTEDGEAWIDLSNAHDANGAPVMTTISWEGQGGVTQTLSVKSFESSANSYPEAHDDICMLGCITDTTRQGAIIEYVSGVDAPTYQIYQGLGADATNPYSLSGKNQIGFGYSTSTGKAYMNVYGDAYIGDRNRNTFLEYKQNGAGGNPELNIKAKVQILPNGSTINGQSIPDYIKDNQNNYDDSKVKADIAILDATTQDLQKQIDGAIETWFMTGVPTLQNAPANEWTTDDEKDKHIGDLYYDKATTYAYRFLYDDETDTYGWQHITDDALAEALRIASEAQETADGKRTIYSVWGAWMKNNVNTLEVGDLFIPAANTTQGGVTYKANKVYKCTTDGSATFQSADYIDDAQAQAKIDAFVSNTYNPDKINLQSQIDGKAETFRQATDPSLDWYVEEGGEVTLDVRANHVGDLWMDISANGGKKTYIYEDNGESADPRYEWKAQEVPDEVFDEIDGKSTIFGNAIATPPTNYKKDDMWLLPAAATINGTAYKKGDVLSASQDSTTYSAAHWSKKIRYTDDSAFNGYIDEMLNGSHTSGSSSIIAAATQRAIMSALGGSTIMEGGLMLTSMIALRQNTGTAETPQYTTWAGISGIYDNTLNEQDEYVGVKGHGIAAWYGGAKVDLEDKSNYWTEEQIAAWEALTDEQKAESPLAAKSLFRMDGSGYLATANISWNDRGQITIKNITTLSDSQNTNLLNELTTFNSAFKFATDGEGSTTAVYIKPQVPFETLYVGTTSANKKEVATKEWVGNNYVSTAFFRQLFRAFKPNATAGQADVEVQPNTIDATISNIKAMVGLWTEQYISALGRGADGGGGGASVLYGLNDVTPNATGDGVMGAQDGYVLTYNGSTHHWYAAATAETYVLPQATSGALGGIKIGFTTSGKNYAIALDANGKAYVNVPWTDTTYTLAGLMGSTAIGGATQPIYWNGTAFVNTTYTLAKSVPADAKFTDTTYSFSNADATLAWSTRTKIATTGGTDIYVTLPANPNTNTWRNIFLDGTEKLTTGINTKGLNFVGDGKTTISFLAAGTEEGQSGNANYATLKISSTWRGLQNNLTTSSSSTTDSLSAYQGYLLANGSARDNTKLPLSGGTLTGNLTINPSSGAKYIQIGTIRIGYDSDNNALKVYKVTTSNNVETEVAANFYALGAISALGQGVDGGGGGGQGDVTWDLLASSSDTRQIALSHLTTALAGYSTTSHTHTTTIAADSGTNQLTLAYGTKYKITAGDTSFIFTMPSADDTNTWRNIYVAGTQQITTAVNTKGLNFAAGNNVSLSFAAAGTGSGQSGNANYGTLTISATDTTYSNATQSVAGLMSAADKKKLDGIAEGANKYSLPLAASGTRGGVQIGYTENGKNYAVQLSNEKMYVNVPWENTWRGIQNNLTSDSTTDSLSAAQGKALANGSARDDTKLPLDGGTMTGALGKSSNYLIKPVADYRTTSDAHTGCIAITLPATIGDTMVSMWIDVYNYSTNTSFSVHCGGYTRSNSTWQYNPFALVFGASHRVRFGHNGTSFVIYIGETNSTWSYPQVTVRDVVLGHSPTYTNWYKDWSISFVTSVSNVTADCTRYAITSSNIGSQSVSYATTSGSCSGNASTATTLQTSRTIWGQSFNGSANVTGDMSNVGGITFSTLNDTSARNLLYQQMATNDYFRIRCGGTAANGGWVEIATADDGTEPIYIRQYTGVFSTVARTFTLLDSSGNTSIPKSLSVGNNITAGSADGTYIQIGGARIVWDNQNKALKVIQSDNSTAANFYATGAISALGQGVDGGGGGGQGDVTWALLETAATGGRTIDGSYLKGTVTRKLTLSSSTYKNNLDIYRSDAANNPVITFTNVTDGYLGCIGFAGSSQQGMGKMPYVEVDGTMRVLIHAGNIGSQSVNYATSASFANGLEVNSSSFTTGAAGWYKLAVFDGPDPRGSVRIGLITAGGSFTPFYAELYVKNGWSDTDFILYGRFDYISKFRLTKDSAKTYIEGYFPTANTEITLRKIKNCAYVNDEVTNWSLYSSATAGSGTMDGNEFAKSSLTSVFSCSGYLEAKEFVKSGSSNSYVLLGGGGDAAISDLNVHSALVATQDGSGNVITSTYLKLSGGTMTGGITCSTSGANLKWGNITIYGGGSDGGTNSIYIGNDVTIGDCNVSGAFGMMSTGANAGFRFFNSGGSSIGGLQSTAGVLQWINSAGTAYNILDSSNSSVSKSGETLTVKINGTSQSLTNTNTTYSASTGLSLSGTTFSVSSTYQTYISHGESAYNSLSNYLPLSGGTMTSTIYFNNMQSGKDAGIDCTLNTRHILFGIGTSGNAGMWEAVKGWIMGIDTSNNVFIHGNADTATKATNDSDGNAINSTYLKNSGGNMSGHIYLTGAVANSSTQNTSQIVFGTSNNQYVAISSNSNAIIINPTTSNTSEQIELGVNGHYSRINGSLGVGVAPSYKLHVSGDVYATGGVTCASDARMKDVLGDTTLSVEQIANAPAVRFYWKKDRSLGEQVGTLAQYWQNVLPQSVSDKSGELSLQYGVAALLSTIVVAKKVVNHEQRIKELEEECERLRTELSQYKTI